MVTPQGGCIALTVEQNTPLLDNREGEHSVQDWSRNDEILAAAACKIAGNQEAEQVECHLDSQVYVHDVAKEVFVETVNEDFQARQEDKATKEADEVQTEFDQSFLRKHSDENKHESRTSPRRKNDEIQQMNKAFGTKHRPAEKSRN